MTGLAFDQLLLRLAASRGEEEVLAVVREGVRPLIGADGVTFVLREGPNCFYAAEDAIGPLWKGQRFPLETCISGWSMLNRQTVVIPDIYADARIPHAAYRPTFVKSLVMVPVHAEDPVAAVGAYWRRKILPSSKAISALECIAHAAALALTNVALVRSLNSALMSVERARNAVFVVMAALAESRHAETGGHILRTQHYIRALAEAAYKRGALQGKIELQEIELVFKSAPLHDIGKIAIPDRILLKPGRLDDAEMEIMKTHADLGRQAIEAAAFRAGADLNFLHAAAEIAHTHHEKWDGTGYPRSLSGQEIPIAGRMMALGDVYDALVSKRVYKGAISHDEAIGVIARGAGNHFDPELTTVFLDIAPEIKEIHSKFEDAA